MPIADIPCIKFIHDTHRCYEYILDFVIAHSALGAYINVYHNQAANSFFPQIHGEEERYPTFLIEGKASGKNLQIVPYDILTNVMYNNTRKGTIPYFSDSDFYEVVGNSTNALVQTLENLGQAMFVNYFENNVVKFKSKYGIRKYWPPVLQFAAVIRDAVSHGGAISIDKDVAPVAYFGLQYSRDDNGTKILHNHLTNADLFYLMLDMDEVF